MGGQKTVTIGVTVNLEHYENLRLEVSGEVDSPEDAEDLSRFLDAILCSFGKNDPATADRINSYRRRVLPGTASHGAPESGSGEIIPVPARDRPGQKPETVSPGPGIPPAEIMASPGAAPGGAPAGTCASCGSPVSPAEQKMSQLFTSRTLCRICMKNL